MKELLIAAATELQDVAETAEHVAETVGPEISIKAEPLFTLGALTVTNSLFLAFITTALFFVLVFLLRNPKMIPNGIQNFFEWVIEGFLGLMESVLGTRKAAVQHFPLIFTIFLFIMISNWLGLLPGVGSIGLYQIHHGQEVLVPLFRAPAADLNFTIGLAIVAMLSVQFAGIFAIGLVKYLKKFFTLKKPFPIFTFVGLLELLSEFVKVISFSFRLFGNVFAGEVLLIIIAFLVPYFIPLPFLFLEIFVGFIQAFIFSMLTMVFIGMAVSEEH